MLTCHFMEARGGPFSSTKNTYNGENQKELYDAELMKIGRSVDEKEGNCQWMEKDGPNL
jgi:hypothetical protein